jgi:anaerobic selenocysteine-containing dehydrogenase
MPGFGPDAFGPGMPLNRPEDWYLKAIANIAFGDAVDEAVPDASADELDLLTTSRRFLPVSVFDEAKWKAAVRPREWPKVVYILNRGGRFAVYGSGYDGLYMKNKMGSMFHVFMDEVAAENNSITGEPFPGYPVWRGQRDSADESIDARPEYPMALFTYKEPWGGQSRTISNYWGNLGLVHTNHIVLNALDAASLGIEDGQSVKLVSASNPDGTFSLGNGDTMSTVGPAKVVEGILPGTVAASWHFGHWAYGSVDMEIDGELVKGDARRTAGMCPNSVMLIDPNLCDVCLTDPVGGSASFYDTSVAVVPA